jgi:hypothetical protein
MRKIIPIFALSAILAPIGGVAYAANVHVKKRAVFRR